MPPPSSTRRLAVMSPRMGTAKRGDGPPGGAKRQKKQQREQTGKKKVSGWKDGLGVRGF